jgi:hypothetical protein
MDTYARITRMLRAPLAAALLLGMPIAHAAGIALQNVNYAKADRKVIVKGKLDGFAGATTVTLRNLTTGADMATVSAKANQFGFRVNVPLGVRVPCEISVEARNASHSMVRTAEVRNAQGICGKYTVALSGVVTDDVIPFATVTVTLGGVTYTTVADANGRYTLPITSANLDELVKIEAAGASPATGEPIEFVNLTGSFSRLLDDQLTEGGAAGNVTNVTTASYVLVLAASDGEPTSEEGLRAAETSVDATQLLQLAALIKLIVDDPDYSLPAGETSLLAFVSDPEAVAAYLATVPQEDLNGAIASILQDSNLVAGFAAADIPSRYYSIPAAQPGYLARQGQILEFSVNGSGRLLDYNQVFGRPINEPYSWTVDGGRLVVNFATPVTYDSFDTLSNSALFQPLLTDAERARILAANGPGGQIPVRYSVIGYTYTRVADGALVDTASVETRSSSEVLPFTLNDGSSFTPSLPPFARTERSGQSLRASIDVQAKPFAASCPAADGATCVPGQWLASFLYSPGTLATLAGPQLLAEAPYGDVVTFAPGGTVTGRLAGLTATWTVDSDGALIVNYPSGWQQKVQIVDTLNLEFGVFNELSRGNDRYATYTVNVKAAGGITLDNAYLGNAAGKFWNAEINSWIPSPRFWNPDGTRASYFGWQFFANSNTAINVLDVTPQDCGGDGQMDDPKASLGFSTWQPAGNGVAIPRGFQNSRLRTWYPAASTVVNGERQFYVMEDERYVAGPRTGQLFFPPRINYLREIDAPWTCSN